MASMATSTSTYLTSQTESLESTTPVSPSVARTAQIPLQSFTIPTFPPEAFDSDLTSLILTCDIALNQYSDLLKDAFDIPDLPSTIGSLTLELFSLGYPAGWLAQLGQKLKNIKSLTLYSQLLAGTTEETRKDAVAFVEGMKGLREVHLLDVFAPKGFYTEISGRLGDELKFLEINFTFRHGDDDRFLDTVPGKEVLSLVGSGLLGLSLCISAPQEEEGMEVGVGVLESGGEEIVERLEKGPGSELVMCDITMFEIGSKEVERVLKACKKVKVLNFSVTLEDGWEDLFEVLGQRESGVEFLDIVGVPGEELVKKMKENGELDIRKEDLEALSKGWKELTSVKVSILRTSVKHWTKEGNVWEKST